MKWFRLIDESHKLAHELDTLINKYLAEMKIPSRDYIRLIAVLYCNIIRLCEPDVPEDQIAEMRLECLNLVVYLVLDDDFLNDSSTYKTLH